MGQALTESYLTDLLPRERDFCDREMVEFHWNGVPIDRENVKVEHRGATVVVDLNHGAGEQEDE
jgi:hypothetical protein